ncbi:MAG: hypothetical protein ACRC0V_10940 [Fusobacteriaceae bacterium]
MNQSKQCISNRLESLLKSITEINLDIINEDYLSSIDRNYLDISTSGDKISYIRTSRLELFDGDFYNEELRKKYATQGKPVKVLQVVLSRDLHHTTQRKIGLAFLDKESIEVRIVAGSDIAKYYNEDNYSSINGELGDSCMRHCPSSLFEVYKKYCEMVILVDSNDKVYARSIIFRNCILGIDDSVKDFMSRVYAVTDSYKDYLIEWGLANNFYIFSGRFDNDKIIVNKDEMISAQDIVPYFLTEDLIVDEFHYLPYMDNFQEAFTLNNGLYGIAFDCERVAECEKTEIKNEQKINSIQGGIRGDDGGNSYCDDCSFPCASCYEYKYRTFSDKSVVNNGCESCSDNCCECEL